MQWKQWLSATVACSMLATAAYAEDKVDNKPAVAAPAAKPAEKTMASLSNDAVILKVDGENVTKGQVLETWQSMFPKGRVPDFNAMQENIRDNVLRGVATERVLLKKASASGLENDAEVKSRLEQIRNKVILQVYLEKEAGARVTEADIRKRLDEENAKIKDKKQAHARHILVKTKEEAEAIVAKLKSGAKFDELAKKSSLDKTSGEKGGDLGFFGAEDMVPEFSKAVFALKVGAVSAPVESSFGWHVIKLEELKPIPPLTYEAKKDEFTEELKSKALEGFVEELVGKSNIVVVAPDGSEKPIANAAQPAAM